ncbi:type II toxin-antitoxin system VapC family toxin [Mucilaginibacter myungsuensis]|uniref:type II toxin-antitoxin system VapC family toxin n=1 Tax=Mucilaginibacter myungsuensis TaxID=649104 RepID=UPI001D166052|nr:type II toxin-antitoxin system VapC family toxin [Mucilaginibacter myungsuensis]MDN3599277.1 type II toxin-antitoxin system VapC family toxin [Mucilaginibacter myungsuensis]
MLRTKDFISIASLWEITIKLTKKKPGFDVSLGELYYFLEVSKIEILPVDFSHLNTLLHLPRHHDDPFDRMMIAQAITENLNLVSTDGAFPAYGVNLIW